MDVYWTISATDRGGVRFEIAYSCCQNCLVHSEVSQNINRVSIRRFFFLFVAPGSGSARVVEKVMKGFMKLEKYSDANLFRNKADQFIH